MDWRDRHRLAIKSARQACGLESPGRFMTAFVVTVCAIAAIWIFAGPNEAWPEILGKIAGTCAVSFIFPAIYFWNLLRAGPFIRKNSSVALVVSGAVFAVLGVALLAIGIIQARHRTQGDPEIAQLQSQLATIQSQLTSLTNSRVAGVESSASTDSPKQSKNYTERDIRELLDSLDQAGNLIEKRMFPVTNGITTAMANWYSFIPNMGVQKAAEHFRKMKEQLPTEVWEPINEIVYGQSNRHPEEMRIAFALDHEAAKGELSRAMQAAIDKLVALPENPSETTRDLVKPEFNEAYRQAEIVYNWLVNARNRIASMKTNLKNQGGTGFEKG